MLERTSPYRLCDYNPNPCIGRNTLASTLPANIASYFDEITDDTRLLMQAYVSQRHDPYDGGAMNRSSPGEYCNNMVATWSARRRAWVPKKKLGSASSGLGHMVPDLAQLHLLDEVVQLTSFLLEHDRQSEPLAPTRRLIFVQGGIGCGKTTMLHHLLRVLLPELASKHLLPYDYVHAIADLNIGDDIATVDELWGQVLPDLRKAVGKASGLDNTSGWWLIAQPFLYTEAAELLPHLATSPDPERAKTAEVHRAADHSVFLERVARYLTNRLPPTVILYVLDNLDRQPSIRRQLAMVWRLVHILRKAPNAVGIVSVREYTLGDLARLKDFAAFQRVNRLHITTPIIGQVVQKRLDIALAQDASGGLASVQILPGVALSAVEVGQIYRRIADCFEYPNTDKPGWYLEDGMREPAAFVHFVTNSNVRAALGLLLEALLSWTFKVGKLVMSYTVQREENRSDIRLPRFTVNELFSSAAVGPYLYFDQRLCDHFQNIFSTGVKQPAGLPGRSPLLHLLRILELFDGAGELSLHDALDALSCFDFNHAENREIFQRLIESGFIESKEGSTVTNIKRLFSTRKLEFYFREFSRSLVYLEIMRSDSVIEYKAKPHLVADPSSPRFATGKTPLADDLLETLKFIYYVMQQEELEYQWVEGNRARLQRFQRIATRNPVCWMLLRSVAHRFNALYRAGSKLAGGDVEHFVAETFRTVKGAIVLASQGGRIYPPIAGEDITLILD